MGLYHKIITESGDGPTADIVPYAIDEKKNGS